MVETFSNLLVSLAGIYGLIGVLVGLGFALRGVGRPHADLASIRRLRG